MTFTTLSVKCSSLHQSHSPKCFHPASLVFQCCKKVQPIAYVASVSSSLHKRSVGSIWPPTENQEAKIINLNTSQNIQPPPRPLLDARIESAAEE